MWEVILLILFGIGFLTIGIRHNKKIHSAEGSGDTFSGSILIDMLLGKLAELVEKLPYWFAKSLFLTISMICFSWAYIKFDALN